MIWCRESSMRSVIVFSCSIYGQFKCGFVYHVRTAGFIHHNVVGMILQYIYYLTERIFLFGNVFFVVFKRLPDNPD